MRCGMRAGLVCTMLYALFMMRVRVAGVWCVQCSMLSSWQHSDNNPHHVYLFQLLPFVVVVGVKKNPFLTPALNQERGRSVVACDGVEGGEEGGGGGGDATESRGGVVWGGDLIQGYPGTAQCTVGRSRRGSGHGSFGRRRECSRGR